jgi:hypothetical protein
MALGLLSNGAQASVFCPGTIVSFRVEPNGRLSADWGYGKRYLCYVNADTAPPTPAGATTVLKDACQTVAAQLATGIGTATQFSTYHATATTCGDALGTGDNIWPPDQALGFYLQNP